mmetsp:Transcript_13964/g.37305  ORF Transcript_13964/g.37305 Transcript_13964/m.37305 type:complete len:664 (+) Transcript_13964:73-2064(+)
MNRQQKSVKFDNQNLASTSSFHKSSSVPRSGSAGSSRFSVPGLTSQPLSEEPDESEDPDSNEDLLVSQVRETLMSTAKGGLNYSASVEVDEEAVEEDKRAWIIDPGGRFYHAWELFQFCLLLVFVTYGLFVSCFIGVEGPSHPIFWIDCFIEGSFVVDFFLQFFVSYRLPNGTLETDRKSILISHFDWMLVVNFVSSVPYNLIIYLSVGVGFHWTIALDFLLLFRVIRFRILLKKLRVSDVYIRFEIKSKISVGLRHLLALFVYALFLVHIFACIFAFVAYVQGPDAYTWLNDVDVLGENPTRFDIYVVAVYYSVYTITTIGYGDITPEGTAGRIFSVLTMGIGAAMYGYILSSVVTYVSESTEPQERFRNDMDRLQQYCKNNDIPDDLNFKARRFFLHKHRGLFVTGDFSVLHDLSPELRGEVVEYIFGTRFKDSLIFSQLEKTAVGNFLPHIFQKAYAAGETIVEENNAVEGSFMITSGRAVSFSGRNSERVPCKLKEMYGETDVFMNRRSTIAVECETFCEVLVFPKDALMHLLGYYPEVLRGLRQREMKRLWERAISEALSRIIQSNVVFGMHAAAQSAKGRPKPSLPKVEEDKSYNAQVAKVYELAGAGDLDGLQEMWEEVSQREAVLRRKVDLVVQALDAILPDLQRNNSKGSVPGV